MVSYGNSTKSKISIDTWIYSMKVQLKMNYDLWEKEESSLVLLENKFRAPKEKKFQAVLCILKRMVLLNY